MKRMGNLPWLLSILLLVMIPITSPQAQPRPEDREEEETILVGRISHVEGQLLRYVPDEGDWVATVRDAPFGVDDALYSDKDGRAEIIMPNNTWMRIDSDTQIQIIVLKDDATEIDVASGVARFYNKGSDGVIKAITPFGYVMAPGETCFDLYVGDNSVEVITLKGTVNFVHSRSKTRYAVIAGASSILADSRQVTAGEGHVHPDWNEWNRDREILWTRRAQVKGESVKYLPPRLHGEAYVLEEHGRWERVYYEGVYRCFWRPIHVSVGWAPFTIGRWTVWYGDNTWIPYEPFGYVTHHYGNWVFVRGFWYWAPPVARIRVHVGPPLFNIGFSWYPGRVAWVHFGVYVGWVPLAPHEPYYCYRRWGPRAVVLTNVNIVKLNTKINRYRNFKHAVIINRNNFYSVNNYGKVRIRNINSTTFIKNYRVAPVVNDTVIRDYRNIRKRHNFKNVKVIQKPHRKVISKTKQSQQIVKPSVNIRNKTFRQNATDIRQGRVPKGNRMGPRKVKDRVVPVNQVNRPVSQVRFEERELKRKVRARAENQKQAGREVQKARQRMPPRLEHKVQKGQVGRKARQDRQMQLWQPGQQKNRHNARGERKIGGGPSQPDFLAPAGAARSRSWTGPRKDSIWGKTPNNSRNLRHNHTTHHRRRAHN